jgi:hypothetical protein
MNVYVVVEGRVVEKEVYTVWIPQVNGALSPVPTVADVAANHFVIVSGLGYPFYFQIIDSALEDVTADGTFDRLVICVDSEDMTLAQKHAEISNHVNSKGYGQIDYRVVVQHFCFETWALANRKMARPQPHDEVLREYRRIYNVMKLDPEGLPPLPAENLNRSQFAEKYLRRTIHDRNRNLTYSKRNPEAVTHKSFFPEVCKRMNETGHIQSFGAFLNAFS